MLGKSKSKIEAKEKQKRGTQLYLLVRGVDDSEGFVGHMLPIRVRPVVQPRQDKVSLWSPDISVYARPVVVEQACSYCRGGWLFFCLLYTSPSPRDGATSRMPSSA